MNSPKRGRKFSFQSEKFTQPPPAPKANYEVEKRYSLGSNDEPLLRCQAPRLSIVAGMELITSNNNKSSFYHPTTATTTSMSGTSTMPGSINNMFNTTNEICRICLQGRHNSCSIDDKESKPISSSTIPQEDALISPCECKGTHGLIHRSCLRRWVTLSGRYCCEICGYQYVTEDKIPRISEWLRAVILRRLIKDIFASLLITSYTILGMIYCILNVDKAIVYPIVASVFLLLWLIWMIWVLYSAGNSFRKYKKLRRRRTIRQPTSIYADNMKRLQETQLLYSQQQQQSAGSTQPQGGSICGLDVISEQMESMEPNSSSPFVKKEPQTIY